MTSLSSSMGTPLVSGMHKMTKMVMISTQPAKNRNVPHFKPHRIVKKTWPIKKVNLQVDADNQQYEGSLSPITVLVTSH